MTIAPAVTWSAFVPYQLKDGIACIGTPCVCFILSSEYWTRPGRGDDMQVHVAVVAKVKGKSRFLLDLSLPE
jgi:hypothetical protein